MYVIHTKKSINEEWKHYALYRKENSSGKCWAGRMPVQRTALTRMAHAARAIIENDEYNEDIMMIF